ncbi:biotin transporter BioY [Cohnella algarum]|uniref:biotin transporter BioY n=1 Tax=Cohnella algarum TaxID=2044859 RepID=UPI001967C066|nr:biotin transporter BioY [Cohnella algarum]MBN2984229.1 biotin transporter BioY [Cohnella algarum]
MTNLPDSAGSPNPSPVAPGPSQQIRGIVYTALFAALFIAFSFVQIPLGFTPVPITLQALAVMLAGGLLGARYGFWSIAIVVLLTAAGLPLLQGRGGLATVFGPTGGFIWMFPVSALLIGLASDRLFRGVTRPGPKRVAALAASIVLFGIAFAYLTGVPWLAYKADTSLARAMVLGCYPYLAGDFIKAAVATVVIVLLRPKLPRLR